MKRKVVLVTGSAQGIGASIIREFASLGYDVVINYNNSKDAAYKLKEEIKKYNVNSLVIKCDISKEEEIKEMMNSIEKEFGGVDILVNNAAVTNDSFFNAKNSGDFKRVLDVNLVGAFLISKAVSNWMLNNKWGRIINISSTNGMNTYYPMCLEYDASKAALISLTHNLSYQFAPYVTVNAVAPGFIATENELKGMDEEFIKSEEEKIFVKRAGRPDEVAKLVAFLASDDAAYVNNTVIRIDGGQYGGE